MYSRPSPGRSGFRWLSRDWSARELVKTDHQIDHARRLLRFNLAEALCVYRELILDLHFALVRHQEIPDLSKCPLCQRLLGHYEVINGHRCLYCGVLTRESA